MTSSSQKASAAKQAVTYLKNNTIVGLGTGSTAAFALEEIGRLVKQGLQVKGVPTSEKTAAHARQLNIPLVDTNNIDHIDLTIDGADEFTKEGWLIKGGGGALFREKIVASLSKEVIIIADASKKVNLLGKFTLPVEVIPFAENYVMRQLQSKGAKTTLRMNDSAPFLTDQKNHIIDADFGLITDPASLAIELNQVEGLVAHGLFIGLATKVIMGDEHGFVIFE